MVATTPSSSPSQEGLDDQWLFAGIVDGRNVWIDHLEHSLDALEGLKTAAAQLVVSTSCSLLHIPIDLDAEPAGGDADLDDEMRSWMAFAVQKVGEVATLAKGTAEGREAIADQLDANDRALDSRRDSHRTSNVEVRARIDGLDEEHDRRSEPVRGAQAGAALPHRHSRALPRDDDRLLSADRRDPPDADDSCARARSIWPPTRQRCGPEIDKVIRFQEEIGLDVLVHGEPERNDMVQYFGEQMEGYVFTENAWVQSYGSRYVRPPIIFGDVCRPAPMTVDWIAYAQSLTEKPVKGMLTGPVTMLEWSFVRDDQPRRGDLRAAGSRDPRRGRRPGEGRRSRSSRSTSRRSARACRCASERWDEYLSWAVYCFRLATAGVEDETQIHTHMCYSDFGDILEHIQAMDADVNLIEAARSRMELLRRLGADRLSRTTSARASTTSTPRGCRRSTRWSSCSRPRGVLRPEQIWVNPDCGLKTRAWDEVEPSLRNMVQAAKQLREELVPAS